MDFQRKQSYLEIPIQVGVRLRPVLETDDPPSDERVELLPSGQVTVEGHVFDPAFCLPEDVTQAELYHAAVEPQVDMLLQGYSVAVVAFGQTGSGKTYTLVGPDATFAMTEAEFGILPRAVRHIFAALKASGESGEHGFTVRTSYLEVGQEEIRDLLNYEAISYRLDVEFDQQGSPVIPGLTQLECTSVSEVLHCLESGASMRQAASTAGTDQQAHTVFTVHVQQEWADGVLLHEVSSSFQFVECSGSELQPAPDDPDDFTINAGLLALQQVVQALLQRRPSVPYTAAKLPAVLKDVIGGNCRTLLVCCLSPGDTDESLAALQYVRPLSDVDNMVTCGASQRTLPTPEPAPPVPPRQVHQVHPLRQQLGSPMSGELPKPVQQQQRWNSYSMPPGGFVEDPGWSPQMQGVFNGAYGGYPQIHNMSQQGFLQAQMASAAVQPGQMAQPSVQCHQQMVARGSQSQQQMAAQGDPTQQQVGAIQAGIGSSSGLETQQLSVNLSQIMGQQMMSPPQAMLSPGMSPAHRVVTSQTLGVGRNSQQMHNLGTNGNPDVVVPSQIIISQEPQSANQTRASVARNQKVVQQQQVVSHSREHCVEVNQPFSNQAQMGTIDQNHTGVNHNSDVPVNHHEAVVNPFHTRRLSLHTLYQNSINRDQHLISNPRPHPASQQHPGQNLNTMNQTHPVVNQNQQLVLRPQAPMSPGVNPSLMSQTLPPLGAHNNNLMLGQVRGHGYGHQQTLVHPYHHHQGAGRLAELGYTASPPLTNLTELSCHRAALLHENALVDLYQRLHVLELHHLAAAQQAALASQPQQQQQPPPSTSEPPKDDDQLFQLEFAAEQYRSLVAAAERLLQELSLDGEQRGRVQEWMCRKQETDECLRSGAGVDSEDELRRLEGVAGGSGASSEADADASERGAEAEAARVRRSQDAGAAASGDVTGLCGALRASLRLTGEPISPSGVDGRPAETSTPNDSSTADRQGATDSLQARLRQLNATLEAKEAQIRALTESAQPEADAAVTDEAPINTQFERMTRVGVSPIADVLRPPPSASAAPVASRRRRAACTEDDLRAIRLSEDASSIQDRLSPCDLLNPCSPMDQKRSSEVRGHQRLSDRQHEGASLTLTQGQPSTGSLVDRSVDACDPAELEADPTADLELGKAAAGEHSDIRREIQKLRDCRDSLHSQRKRINAKICQGGQLDGAETRRLLELDEALHAVDEVLEHKAGRLAVGTAPADSRTLLLNQRRLMPRLLALSGTELRLLYCRTFQRLVDQRIDGREKDLAVADLDARTDEQRRSLKRLQRMVHDLMKERSHYRRQRDELRRRLQAPRGSSGPTVAPPIPPAVVAPLSHEPGTPALARAPLANSRAPSDASSAPEPVLAPTSASHRLRQMLLSGLSRPTAASPTARVTRQRNRVIIQSASQGAEKRARR